MPTNNITEGRNKFEDLVKIGIDKNWNRGPNRDSNSIFHYVHRVDPSATDNRTAEL